MTQSSDGLTERVSSFVDTVTMLQPISKSQKSHLKDATDFINFIERQIISEKTELFLFQSEKC